MANFSEFNLWLGKIFGCSEYDIKKILKDPTALHFLVAWSLFESKCFKGFVKSEDISNYANTVSSTIDWLELSDTVNYFHERYQDTTFLENLLHQQKCQNLTEILKKPFDDLNRKEGVFLLVFVIYRYRNNIFHGNKGVQSWVVYSEQIQHCTHAMQVMVSHVEALKQTINIASA